MGDSLRNSLHRQAERALGGGNNETAERRLAKPLARAPNGPAALARMGEQRLRANDAEQAFHFYMRAVNAAPKVRRYQEKFLELAARGLPLAYSEPLANAFAACLKTPDLASLLENWPALTMLDPRFQAAYGLANRKPFDPVNGEDFAAIADLRPLLSPLFLEGLKTHVVCSPVFEEFVTHIRCHLLRALDGVHGQLPPEEHVLLAAALAHYAFSADYILDTSEEEQSKTDALRRRIETEAEATQNPAALAVLACYRPLYTLANAQRVLETFRASGPLAELVKTQIGDYVSLQDIAAAIPSLTEIDVSSASVREQYESFPCPRWKARSKDRLCDQWLKDERAQRVEGPLRGRNAQILIAGCGTGQEVARHLALFPDAAITAIDLSRTSLSYACMRAKENGLENVVFLQGDILRLVALPRKFDYISAAGVLHHMEDPVEGWRVLCGLLKPGGLMRIGLYSEIGRTAMVAARAAIAKGNYPPDREGMLRFRRESPALLNRETLLALAGLRDYYHLNTYRDFLFHVREHRFDTPRIGAILEQLGLAFEGFDISSATFAKYRAVFPHDPAGVNLHNWHRFEQQNPDTFVSMYGFWCRKRSLP